MAEASSSRSASSIPTQPRRSHHSTAPGIVIKKLDAEPLTRVDIQYDFLQAVFGDETAAFTSPNQLSGERVPFHKLYIDSIYSSSKTTKATREKMVATPAFAFELCKTILVTNSGRINTTMAFFPDMKTALRTYHPIPSLQKTDGNAQDAPRLKSVLKGVSPPHRSSTSNRELPATLEDIIAAKSKGIVPPTTAVRLITALCHSDTSHLPRPLTFIDLFLPVELSSTDRARAFLWHLFHYLEDSSLVNPFNDGYSHRHLGSAPLVRRLSKEEFLAENKDTPEELAWAAKMARQRSAFLRGMHANPMFGRRLDNPPPIQPVDSSSSSRPGPQRTTKRGNEHFHRGEDDFLHYVPPAAVSATNLPVPSQPPRKARAPRRLNIGRATPHQGERTLLQHTWNLISTTDPLLDSSEEEYDEHERRDYAQRLAVIRRLQMRPSPIPEPRGAPPLDPHRRRFP